jgi:hypothetical protein
VFADADAGGGLPRSTILERARGPWSQQTLASRVELFTKLGLLQTVLDKKHQSRYVLNPAGLVGLLLIDRVAERGGVDELLSLLDRTRALVEGWRRLARWMTALHGSTASSRSGRGPAGLAAKRETRGLWLLLLGHAVELPVPRM